MTAFQSGDLVDVWMTGLGAAPFADNILPLFADLGYDVNVTVGGVPGAFAVERVGLQPGEPVAAAGAGAEDQELVADELAASVDENRRAAGKADSFHGCSRDRLLCRDRHYSIHYPGQCRGLPRPGDHHRQRHSQQRDNDIHWAEPRTLPRSDGDMGLSTELLTRAPTRQEGAASLGTINLSRTTLTIDGFPQQVRQGFELNLEAAGAGFHRYTLA